MEFVRHATLLFCAKSATCKEMTRRRRSERMKKPCGTRACRGWCDEQGVYEPSESVCCRCGAEGPMSDWYIESENDVDDDE